MEKDIKRLQKKCSYKTTWEIDRNTGSEAVLLVSQNVIPLVLIPEGKPLPMK